MNLCESDLALLAAHNRAYAATEFVAHVVKVAWLAEAHCRAKAERRPRKGCPIKLTGHTFTHILCG